MLSSNLQTLLDNRLRYLPEITGKALTSLDWATEVIHIGHDQGLHMDEIEELQAIVLKSMTGLLPPADFENNIINVTAASPAVVEKIIQKLNEKVFEPIHTFVMNNGKVPTPTMPGIEVVTEHPELDFFETHTPSTTTTPELVIPEPDHHTTQDRPVVPGDFESFFTNTKVPTPKHSVVE